MPAAVSSLARRRIKFSITQRVVLRASCIYYDPAAFSRRLAVDARERDIRQNLFAAANGTRHAAVHQAEQPGPRYAFAVIRNTFAGVFRRFRAANEMVPPRGDGRNKMCRRRNGKERNELISIMPRPRLVEPESCITPLTWPTAGFRSFSINYASPAPRLPARIGRRRTRRRETRRRKKATKYKGVRKKEEKGNNSVTTRFHCNTGQGFVNVALFFGRSPCAFFAGSFVVGSTRSSPLDRVVQAPRGFHLDRGNVRSSRHPTYRANFLRTRSPRYDGRY